MKSFKPRTTQPEPSNRYYTRRAAGGVSYCIQGNPEAWSGSVLANCVGYAWGRIAEIEENEHCTIGVPESRLKRGSYAPRSAQAWLLSTNGRKTGMTPKLGAVAVWKHKSKNLGHVAVVETIDPATGSWQSSESAYEGAAFRIRHYNAAGDKDNYKLLGYIYPFEEYEPYDPEPQPTPEPELKVGDKVEIIASGRASSYGDRPNAGGIGWTRFIKKIYKNRAYPYQVGNASGTTGFYKREALKKL